MQSLVFSGEKTADDIICRDVGWYHQRFNSHVVVITSDSGLKARCHRAARTAKIKIVDSYLFIDLMDSLCNPAEDEDKDKDKDEEIGKGIYEGIGEGRSTTSAPPPVNVNDVNLDINLARLELRLRDQIRSMQRLSKLRSGGRKKRSDFKRRLSELEVRLVACLDKRHENTPVATIDTTADSTEEQESSGIQSKKEIMNVVDEKTIAQLLRVGSGVDREETWERCLVRVYVCIPVYVSE